MTATVTATAMAAVAPFEMPVKSSSWSSLLLSSGELVDVTVLVGTSCASVAAVEVLDVGLLVAPVGADVLAAVELLDDALLPTAGGPSVLPSRALAACLIFKAVSPESPFILKRSE